MSYYYKPINSTDSIRQGNQVSTKSRLLILLILWVLTFVPIYPSLVWTWLHDSRNSHGILVPLISAFLAWKNRNLLDQSAISNCNWGAILLISSLGIYVLSYAGAVAVASRMMIVSSLTGLILFTLGKNAFSIMKFPLLYLLFMVPVPDSLYIMLSFPLQQLVTKASTFFIQNLAIPAYREGSMLYFAQTQLEVAEACSGLRSMMALLMLGTLFAHFMDKKRLREKAIILLSAVPLSVFLNIVRVTGTGVLAHFWGKEVARGFLHHFSGFVVFALGLVLLFAEYYLLNKLRPE